MTNGPRRWIRRRLRILPRPARKRWDLYTWNDGKIPKIIDRLEINLLRN